MGFLQNHDMIGNRAFGGRIDSFADARFLVAAYACLLLSPLVPMLFMGEEFAASTPFLYFCDFGRARGGGHGRPAARISALRGVHRRGRDRTHPRPECRGDVRRLEAPLGGALAVPAPREAGARAGVARLAATGLAVVVLSAGLRSSALWSRRSRAQRSSWWCACVRAKKVTRFCASFFADLSGLIRKIEFRDIETQLCSVIRFGSDAWDELFGSPRPAELHPFREIRAGNRHAVSTPGDIQSHIRAKRMDLCFELARPRS